MRDAELRAIDSGCVSGEGLMERAGAGVADAIHGLWPGLAGGCAHVLAGPGNNGGDGYVIARLLAVRGWGVQVFAIGDPARLPPDARANAARWQAMGGVVRPLGDAPAAPAPDLVVDALFGTGLSRPPEGAALAALEAAARGAARAVAVDIPSGVCGESGRALAAPLAADLTVTFHRAKPGHYLADGPARCGRVVVADIGLPDDGRAHPRLAQPMRGFVQARAGHKYDHGHALVLSGGAGRSGAARLAARGALRVGAGLVTLGAPGAALHEIACQITALMLTRVDDGDALRGVLVDPRLNALCLGPGLGTGARAAALVAAALAAQRATVLDADALSVLAGDESLRAALHPGCVLTPHMGEFARLCPDLSERLTAPATRGPAFGRLDAVQEAAARFGCTVLLKGPDTVIAAPEAAPVISAAAYDRAAPWLATAGAGDVLAGLISGLLAQGLEPLRAAETAAWLHVEAARRFGPGLIAEDLPEALPQVLRGLPSD